MSTILTLRFPLKPSVTKDDIRSLVDQWVQRSTYYDFKDPEVFTENNDRPSFSQKNGSRASLAHRQLRVTLNDRGHKLEGKEIIPGGTEYLAFRLTNCDTANLMWRADVIFIESPKESPWLLIQLGRSLTRIDSPADGRTRIKYPTIVQLIYDNDLVDLDHDLPLNRIYSISELSEEEIRLLNCKFQNHQRTEFPFLYIYAPQISYQALKDYRANQWKERPLNEIVQELTSTPPTQEEAALLQNLTNLLNVFSKISHLYIASTPEEAGLWKQVTGSKTVSPDTDKPQVALFLPGICLDYQLVLTQPTDFYIIYCQLMLVLSLCQENLPLDYPVWDNLSEFSQENNREAASDSFYLHMNQAMANLMQNRRKELDITQGDLAETLGTTKMLISRLERVQTIKVKRTLIEDIENALSLTPGALSRLETDPSGKNKSAHPTDSSALHYCRHCGRPVSADSRYCAWCGREI